MTRAVLNECDFCQMADHNNQTLCRTARIVDEITQIILHGAHTIVFDERHKYCQEEQAHSKHQAAFVKFVNRGLRHARMFAGRAARAIKNNLSEEFALTLDQLWVQRCIDGSARKIRRTTVAMIGVAWMTWARTIRESNLKWLTKGNPSLFRMVSDLYAGRILVDEAWVIGYIPEVELKRIYITQDIEKRIQRKALELQIPYDTVYKNNLEMYLHKPDIIHYWVTCEFHDGELNPVLVG